MGCTAVAFEITVTWGVKVGHAAVSAPTWLAFTCAHGVEVGVVYALEAVGSKGAATLLTGMPTASAVAFSKVAVRSVVSLFALATAIDVHEGVFHTVDTISGIRSCATGAAQRAALTVVLREHGTGFTAPARVALTLLVVVLVGVLDTVVAVAMLRTHAGCALSVTGSKVDLTVITGPVGFTGTESVAVADGMFNTEVAVIRTGTRASKTSGITSIDISFTSVSTPSSVTGASFLVGP